VTDDYIISKIPPGLVQKGKAMLADIGKKE
jgi:hypothetical protein